MAVQHIKGFRQLAREAEERREFKCGHDATKANTIMQFRGRGDNAGLRPECRRCRIAKTNAATLAARAMRDEFDPGWRTRRREKRIASAKVRSQRTYIIHKAHREIAQEMMQ